MSLLAAVSGGEVYNYESDPIVFKGLMKNALLNKSIVSSIQLFNKVVSSKSGFLDLNVNEPSQILSPIFFTFWQGKSKVEIVRLTEIVKSLQSEHSKDLKVEIKMDIDCAELEARRDLSTVQIFKTTQLNLIPALYPGLRRPTKNISSIISRLQSYWWNIRRILDFWFLLKSVLSFCLLYGTNLKQIIRPSTFCLLVLASNYEFIFDLENRIEH